MRIVAVTIAVLAVTASFAFGRASEPESVGAAANPNRAVVKELKKTNKALLNVQRQLAALQLQTGTSAYSPGTVRGLLREICENTSASGITC